ncbi:MAG: hypothetical protein DRP56_07660 [Planctomycetota bacterium]|nr:MAG: hypothetical protein DRP56_07660 [Planctomycetota bacterium]RKY13819.1 MAG: hypothetical protein DRP52_01775 [Planctomycetota bacterium]
MGKDACGSFCICAEGVSLEFFVQKQALKKRTVFPDSTFLIKIKSLFKISPSVSESVVLSPLNPDE